MTASTFFNRERTLAFLVVDNFHGVFLSHVWVKRADERCWTQLPEEAAVSYMARTKCAKHCLSKYRRHASHAFVLSPTTDR